ncbi:MAG: hypothetical protein QOC81_2736 [Thermoanaerobaculia bacterium]|jgi:hypothetical protein|nr:hypothetical protein [Thermoanaerobaculia bacterium]
MIPPPVPNWYYIAVNGVYLLGVTIWFGGGVAITLAVGPALVASLARREAVIASATLLRKFARIRVLALILMIAGAGTKILIWERHEMAPWMAVRWVAIVLLAWALVAELGHHRSLTVLESSVGPALAPDDPLLAIFDLMRIRAEGLMRASLIAALIALLFT